MTIRTVDASNVADFIAERTAKGSQILNPEQLVEHADRIEASKAKDRTPTPGNPVISTGTEEKLADAPPDPGNAEPSAKANIAKAKANTDPAVQKRIDELTAKQREAEEFAEEEYNGRLRAEARVGTLEREIEALRQQATPVVKEEALVEPDPNDPKYATVADFIKADREYQKQVRDRDIAKAREEERLKTMMERENELLARRIEIAREDIPDFNAVIEAADRVKVELPIYVQNLIRASEVGPQIAYHLAKYPDEQKRIMALRPELALAALGRIEEKYEKKANGAATPTPKPTIETTRAPAPVTPIRSGDAVIVTDPSQAPDFQTYKRLRAEQRKRDGRTR